MNNLLVLPRRNVGSHLKGYEKQSVKTNLFKVEFQDKALITIYSLTIEPEIPKDSTKIKSIVDSAQRQLTQLIGKHCFTQGITSCLGGLFMDAKIKRPNLQPRRKLCSKWTPN